MLEKGTRGDAGFGEEAREPTCLGRRFEPMQKPAGDPAALEIRIHIEHVEVALGLKADEARQAFPKGRDPGAARCQAHRPALPIGGIRRPGQDLLERVIAPRDDAHGTLEQRDEGVEIDRGAGTNAQRALRGFARCPRYQAQGVDLLSHFLLERGIDHALAFQPVLAFEGGCHDLHAEMCLAAGAGACMAGVAMGLVNDVDPIWIERSRKFFSNSVCYMYHGDLCRAAPNLGAAACAVKPDHGQNAGNAGLYCPACLAWVPSAYCCNAAYGHRITD